MYSSVGKVSDLIFLRKPSGFRLSVLAWGDLEPPYACVNFSPSVNVSVGVKQHFSEVVFGPLVGFSLQGKWLVLDLTRTQDMLDSTNSDTDFMNTIIIDDESWMYRYDPQMLLTINWRYWHAGKDDGSRSPHASALLWNPPGFQRKKNKKRFDTFPTK